MGCLFKCCEACSTFNETERLKVFFFSPSVKKHKEKETFDGPNQQQNKMGKYGCTWGTTSNKEMKHLFLLSFNAYTFTGEGNVL